MRSQRVSGGAIRRRRLAEIWTHLHSHPEPSMQEFATAEYLAGLLEQAGLEVRRFDSLPGFTADVGTGPPVIGLRAEMDALVQNTAGGPTAVHSCGHDANMAIVATVMLELGELGDLLEGSVRAIFQPAEELGNGAEHVAALGVSDGLSYLFGVHLRPEEELPAPYFAPSISHGSCLFAAGTITGSDHHGARPHLGANAVEVALEISEGLGRIRVDPQVPSSAKMTMLHAGGDNLNVIPGSGRFGVDLRAQTNEVMSALRAGLESVCARVAASTGTVIDLDFRDAVPAAMIGPRAEAALAAAVATELGDDHLRPRIVTSGSDDFHFYTLRNPEIQAAMLAVGANVQPGLHDPAMTFEAESMERAVGVLLEACLHPEPLLIGVAPVGMALQEKPG
ncbi:amidohydrolase [Arthrobacter sp. H-02-3]|uniref:amidohydrolase n=1 Tax=Arthrobacter sp. H-02-3 TaxID=2703675 RepID=UPI000DD22FC7|nr:amidohydrolase [Arthrobacter sp. H-02-3]PVZ61047.1 amidohydrolase [Arthrobacter sp. H-02-3]